VLEVVVELCRVDPRHAGQEVRLGARRQPVPVLRRHEAEVHLLLVLILLLLALEARASLVQFLKLLGLLANLRLDVVDLGELALRQLQKRARPCQRARLTAEDAPPGGAEHGRPQHPPARRNRTVGGL